MCGVFGFIGPGDGDDLAQMAAAVSHRGPDGEGAEAFPDDNLFLGHKRLSIIDLENGAQPMSDRDQSVWVSFNGEIYNHTELRKELTARGHVFTTDHSDTEVLIHGWKEWGTDLPERLNGMFAFAIWDTRSRSLFLARDRFGEKPLYWAHAGGLFAFASELSAIAAHRHFIADLDILSLQKYFAYGFIPSPRAAYRNSHKLRPGTWLLFDTASSSVHIEDYWSYRVRPDEKPPRLEEAAEEVRHLIGQSVDRRLMSDVPLGLFLSGGIDSSAAAAAISSYTRPDEIHAFSIGFTEPSFDESAHARHVANALGIRLEVETLDMVRAKEIIPAILRSLDEPMADASLLPTSLLAGFARRSVTVALSGDGGDELFAGYDPFLALRPAKLYHAVMPRPAHRLLRSLAEFLPISRKNMGLDFKIRRALQGLEFGPELWNPVWLAPLEVGDIEEIFQAPVRADDLYEEAIGLWHAAEGLSLVDRTLEFFGNFYLPDGVLTKVDRASMTHGLEVRSVFLDNDLVDYVRRLPEHFKTDGRARKIVLKKALEGRLPASILERPKKGFGIPLQTWLRDLTLTATGAARLGLSDKEIEIRIRDHRAGHADHRQFLWSWRVLQPFLSPEKARVE